MIKRAVFLMLVALTTAVGAQAQDNVVVNKNDGSKQAFEMSKVQKITFGDASYTVVGKDGGSTSQFTYVDTKAITFDLVDGIEQVVDTERGQLRIKKTGNVITVEGFSGVDGRVAVYSLDGTLVQSDKAWRGQPISVESLPAGIYVIQVNGQSLKFTKK